MTSNLNKPTSLHKINSDIDYIVCIDENNNSNLLSYVFKKLSNGEVVSDTERYFTVTACIFKKPDYAIAKFNLENLKKKYWPNGMFFSEKHNQNVHVCFHTREIRKQENAFSSKFINYNEFMIDLSQELSAVNCKIISCTIDMVEYIKQKYEYNVYTTAFLFLLERYIYATDNHKKGVVVFEARGKNEDKELLNSIKKIFTNGTKTVKADELNEKISGIYFNPKWNTNYDATYIGLEIADLFSYPIHKFMRSGVKDKSFNVIEEKIDQYPNYINRGIKLFPNKK